MKTVRLFIALELPDKVRNELKRVSDELRDCGAKVSWVKPQNMHLTVRFLGDTEERLVDVLKSGVQTIGGSPTTVHLSRLGAFPNLRRPRVIWAGIDGVLDPIYDVAGEIERMVQRLGFEPDNKKFKPHLTIGRIRDPRRAGDLTEAVESCQLEKIEFPLDRVMLVQSTLTPQGPIYKTLAETKLGEKFSG